MLTPNPPPKAPKLSVGQTYFVQTGILSWEDTPTVFCSIGESEQLQNKDGEKVISN